MFFSGFITASVLALPHHHLQFRGPSMLFTIQAPSVRHLENLAPKVDAQTRKGHAMITHGNNPSPGLGALEVGGYGEIEAVQRRLASPAVGVGESKIGQAEVRCDFFGFVSKATESSPELRSNVTPGVKHFLPILPSDGDKLIFLSAVLLLVDAQRKLVASQ